MLLREHFGKEIFVLPLCSAAGDQCPVDLVRWVEPESDLNDPNCKRNNPPKRKADPSMFDIAGMKKAGKRITNEIIDTWEEGLDEAQSEAVFSHKIINMNLPIRRASLTDVNIAKKAIIEYLKDKGDIDYNDVANLQNRSEKSKDTPSRFLQTIILSSQVLLNYSKLKRSGHDIYLIATLQPRVPYMAREAKP